MFDKLLKPLGDLIFKSRVDKGHEILIGIGPTILFTFNYLQNKCLEAGATRQVPNYSYCNKIYSPAEHEEYKQQRKLKGSSYYKKGRPRSNYVNKFKIHKPPKKYKCFICGEEGHYALKRSKYEVHKDRLIMYQALELPPKIDIISINSNDSE